MKRSKWKRVINNISSKLEAFLDMYLSKENYDMSLLDSGGTNCHYKVTSKKFPDSDSQSPAWFLKVFITNSLQVVDRQQQFHIQQQLAMQGLAPEPIALSPCGNYWLEHWCSLETGDTDNQSSKARAELLAIAIAKIHQCRILAPELDVKAEWLRYLAVANQESTIYRDQISQLLAVFQDDDGRQDTFCFCHNDLHVSHVLKSDPLRIVDWEYSAIGNRYFDLAACAMVNEMKEKQLENFIDRYSAIARIPKSTVTRGIKRLRPVVDFTNELWHNAYNTIS